MRNPGREAITARDEAVERIGRATRWIGTAAVAGALFAAAGFAHLIPTRLPSLNSGDSSSSSSSSSNSSSNSSNSSSNSSSSNSSNSSSSNGGLQPPGNPPANGGSGSGPAQVTSGGS